MVRICSNCEFVNQDDYDFCAKCGTPLVKGVEPKNFIVFKPESNKVNKKALIFSYIVTIVLSWSGFVIGLISKNSTVISFIFFGFFIPFYLLQSPRAEVKKHGYIQLIISAIGIACSLYMFI